MSSTDSLRRKVARPQLETKRTQSLPGEDGFAVTLDGTIRGYASLFDQIDLGSDRVRRGAFAGSLAKRGAAHHGHHRKHDGSQRIPTDSRPALWPDHGRGEGADPRAGAD